MIRSESEKNLYKMIIGYKMGELNYPLKEVKSEQFGVEFVYEIPEDKKEEVLEDLWPFTGIPSIEEAFIDIHEGQQFNLKDYMVIRFDTYNMIVSPWYFKSGGTVLDFLKEDDNGISVQMIKR